MKLNKLSYEDEPTFDYDKWLDDMLTESDEIYNQQCAGNYLQKKIIILEGDSGRKLDKIAEMRLKNHEQTINPY